MAKPSRLDQVEPIGAKFNNANAGMEKRLQAHELTPSERQHVEDLRKSHDQQRQQEISAFNNPVNRNELREQKFIEIVNRNQHPTPEFFPPGMRNRTMSRAQMYQLADVGIKQDHQKRLNDLQARYQSGVNDVLKKAQDNGRGPKRSMSQEFSRVNENDNDRGREHDRGGPELSR